MRRYSTCYIGFGNACANVIEADEAHVPSISHVEKLRHSRPSRRVLHMLLAVGRRRYYAPVLCWGGRRCRRGWVKT